MTLTGEQLRGLSEALLDAYPERDDLEQLFFFSLDRRLGDYVGEAGMRTVVLRLLQAAQSEAWLDQLIDAVLDDRGDNPALRVWAGGRSRSAPEPLPPPDQRLLDSKYFDLREVRHRIREARRGATGGLLALGLPDTEMIVVKKLCDWLPHLLGAVEPKELLALRPDLGSVDARVKQVLSYLPDLDTVNVVLPVLAAGVPASVTAAFWTGVRQQVGVQRHLLVPIFVGASAVPDGVTSLAAPSIHPSDVADWTEQMVGRLGWDPRLAGPWSSQIILDCGGEPIDTRRMFEVMDRSIRDVRHRQAAFRRRLEELT
ncbi:effector-associated domain EAD1-containing protein [Actinoplanes sp. NPDC049265]|uniref:effector-associated domain EAD1-containing protein n=1 Tax=Actinoplanes sp. NPDC049265 TaxID=3363902 RepID=UPI003723653B